MVWCSLILSATVQLFLHSLTGLLHAAAAAAAAQGADIDVPREEDNRTPLHIAVNEGHAEAVEALLDAGAKVWGPPFTCNTARAWQSFACCLASAAAGTALSAVHNHVAS